MLWSLLQPHPTLTGRSVLTFTRTIGWCDTEPKLKSKHLALLYHESEHSLRVTRANIIKSHQHRPTGFLCANIKKKKKTLKSWSISVSAAVYIYIEGPNWISGLNKRARVDPRSLLQWVVLFTPAYSPYNPTSMTTVLSTQKDKYEFN